MDPDLDPFFFQCGSRIWIRIKSKWILSTAKYVTDEALETPDALKNAAAAAQQLELLKKLDEGEMRKYA